MSKEQPTIIMPPETEVNVTAAAPIVGAILCATLALLLGGYFIASYFMPPQPHYVTVLESDYNMCRGQFDYDNYQKEILAQLEQRYESIVEDDTKCYDRLSKYEKPTATPTPAVTHAYGYEVTQPCHYTYYGNGVASYGCGSN